MPVILSTNGSEYQTGNWAEEIIYNEDGSSVTQFWLSQGSDGWRLDVADEVSTETWREFRKSVKALNSDAVIVGEIWTDATGYLLGDMYDSVMNYMFRGAVTSFAMGGTAADSTKTLERLRERYPEEALYAMMNLVGSHDTTRVLSYLDGIPDNRDDTSVDATFPTYEKTSELAKQRQYLTAFLQFTYAGAPTIYYGDEIGMRYVEGLTSVEGGYERTGARSPMQWDSCVNAGFSAAPKEKLYIPQDPAADRPTVAQQLPDPDSLLNLIKHLISLRRAHPALQNRGAITFVSNGAPKQALAYEREQEGEKLLVAVNPFREAVEFSYSGKLSDALFTFGGQACQTAETVTLPPVSAVIYKIA